MKKLLTIVLVSLFTVSSSASILIWESNQVQTKGKANRLRFRAESEVGPSPKSNFFPFEAFQFAQKLEIDFFVSETYTIQIKDMEGKQLFQTQSVFSQSAEIDITNLRNGVYELEITTPKRISFVSEFIIE